MKLEEEFVGRPQQFIALLQNTATQLEAGSLTVRGENVELPDSDLEFKISHKSELGEHKLTVSIEWLAE